MTMSHPRRTYRAYSVLIATLLAIAYTTVAAPPATAVGYGSTRNCRLQMTINRYARQEVRRLQYGLQSTGYSIYADGRFGPRYMTFRQTVASDLTACTVPTPGRS